MEVSVNVHSGINEKVLGKVYNILSDSRSKFGEIYFICELLMSYTVKNCWVKIMNTLATHKKMMSM